MPCKTGNCQVKFGDVQVNDSDHPNKAPFEGTLLLLDEPSDMPPHGSDGHLIHVPMAVARKRLDTLPGMAVNYSDDLEEHNPQKKVGVITQAWIDGNEVKVRGVVWKKDFPDALAAFKRNRGRLGMSMELGNVYVRDKDEPVWHLEDFHFTGGTILKKNSAAYEGTSLSASKHFVRALAAAASAVGIIQKGGTAMADKAKEKDKKTPSQTQLLVNAMAAAVQKVVGEGLAGIQAKQDAINQQLVTALTSLGESQKELVNGLHELALERVDAAADEDADVEEVDAAADPSMADATMTSSKRAKGGDASDASDDPSDDASDDATDYEAAMDPTSYTSTEQDDTGSGSTPGDLNPNASKNASSNAKSGSTDLTPGGAAKSMPIAAARRVKVAEITAAAKVIRSLTKENTTLKDTIKRQQNRIGAIEASLERYADRVERRSVTPEIQTLLEKAGYDVRELVASKQRLSVNDVDQMFASSGISLEPQMRAAFKNQLLQLGLMETGEMKRFN